MSVRPSKRLIKENNIQFFGKQEIPEDRLTARKTMKSERFQRLCSEAGVSPTKRQAAKFNRRDGRWKGMEI
jgi:hypothetical protein